MERPENEPRVPGGSPSPSESARRRAAAVDAIADRFDAAWSAGETPEIDAFAAEVEADLRPDVLGELVAVDLEHRWRAFGRARDPALASSCWTLDDYLARFPELRSPDSVPLDLIVEEFRVRSRWGDSPDPATFIGRFPERAAELERVLGSSSIESGLARPGSVPREIGDYRILREVGRGGMGVVYEAEQLSLSRRVALKVLPFAALLDARQTQRFKNEAMVAAQLAHPHIVDVYGFGSDRGVHFYAMRLVDGLTLSELIHRIRRNTREGARKAPVPAAAATVSSDQSSNTPEYVRGVARMGVFLAEALDHAHQQGVIHRDIKPSNIIVDREGKPWITDFGLASTDAGTRITRSGDILGTLRYMSPEQAEPRRFILDHRTDIYSLGVTLYEALTLSPALAGETREAVVRQIFHAEPRPPRRLNPAIPRELETIVQKASAKSPAERYYSAADLATDLRRFLENRPIRARRPRLVARSVKWARRHRAVAGTAAAGLVLSVAVAVAGVLWQGAEDARRYRDASGRIRMALEDVARLRGRAEAEGDAPSKWAEAIAAAKQAELLLPADLRDGSLSGDVRRTLATLEDRHAQAQARLARERRDRDMLVELESILLEQLGSRSDAARIRERTTERYRDAFREYGIDPHAPEIDEPLAAIRASPIREDLLFAVDAWANWARGERQERLRALARALDTDTWRNLYRDAREQDDAAVLAEMAGKAPAGELPPQTLYNIGNSLIVNDRFPEAKSLLSRAQVHHPGDFMINLLLGVTLLESGELAEAVRFLSAAVALRPGNVPAHRTLAGALQEAGRGREAIAVLRRAAALDAAAYDVYSALAYSLARSDGEAERREAISWFEAAIAAHPRSGPAHTTDFSRVYTNFGNLLWILNDLARAVEMFEKSLELVPGSSLTYSNLGTVRHMLGELDGAETALREAIRLDKSAPRARVVLGQVLMDRARFAEALVELERGLELSAGGGDLEPGLREAFQKIRDQCAAFIVAEDKLDPVLAGTTEPASAGECIVLAGLAMHLKRYDGAAGLFEMAFAKEPELEADGPLESRYSAACAAALAGTGQGQDAGELDASRRARRLTQALEWLRADLAAWPDPERLSARERARWSWMADNWTSGPFLARVRDGEHLEALPEPQRSGFRELWREVAGFRAGLARAGE